MLRSKIESLLFVSIKPLTIKSLFSFLNKDEEQFTEEEIAVALNELKQKYNSVESGVQMVEAGDGVQFVSNPENAELVKRFVKDDFTGELTPASLETLTVIAFRGPITKPELEQIRGVNCSQILRNLLIRGLVIGDENKQNMQTYYQVTTDFLKHLGINSVEELPDYAKLHVVENLEEYLNKAEAQSTQITEDNPEGKVEEVLPVEEVQEESPVEEAPLIVEVVEVAPEIKKNRESSDEEIY